MVLSRPWLFFGLLGGGRRLKSARTLMLSSPWFLGFFDPFIGSARRLKSASTVALSSLCLPFSLPWPLAARTSMLSAPCLVVLVVLGFGAGPPGFVDGAAKAFGRTLKPAASVRVKMSFFIQSNLLKDLS